MEHDHELVEIDEIDRAILNRIQSDFPIESSPYQVLGEQLGMPEDQVLDRVRAMRKSGLIRRIGGNFSAGGVGYSSTLCGARVPEEKFDLFVETINQYSGVTHNYRRAHDMNVWFTFIAPSLEDIEIFLKEIAEATGVDEIYSFPAEITYKIKVDFQFEEQDDGDDQ